MLNLNKKPNTVKQRKPKVKKVKPQVTVKLDRFVTDISSITGFKHGCVKTKSGYFATIQVPGIDIVNAKQNDKDICYTAWGNAIQSCKVNSKPVFLKQKPCYDNQIKYLSGRLAHQNHPYRRELLSRQIEWLEYYSDNQTDRMSYIMFFGKEPKELVKSAENYIHYLTAAKTRGHLCTREEMIPILRIMLCGEE